MGEVLQFLVLGIGTGSLYVLLALGIVLIYRASGVVNFSQGALGLIGTYVWWELRYNHGVPYPYALLAGLAASAAAGALMHLLVMRPLRSASSLTKVIATLALLLIIDGAAYIRYPSQNVYVPATLPTSTVSIAGKPIAISQLILLAISLSLVVILWLAYRYSKFGVLTTAVSENTRSAAALGYSSDTIATVNWAVGGALAALAGILIVPISGLQVSELTLMVIPALAAAMVGSLASFPLTMVGGLVIGAAESELGNYVSTPGWSEAVPFILIFAILVIAGRSIPTRGVLTARLPRLGTGAIRPVPLILACVAYILIVHSISNPNWVAAITIQVGSAIILISIVVLIGYTGQLSLAQMTMAGIGTLLAARLAGSAGLPFPVAVVLAVCIVIPIGLAVGVTGLRARGVGLAVLTLLLADAAQNVIFGSATFVGLSATTSIGSPSIFGIAVGGLNHPDRYSAVVLLSFVVVGVAVANLRRGRTGRRLIAVRANERAAAALGVRVVNVKLYAFALSGAIAALGGILVAFINPSVQYTTYGPSDSITAIQNAVVGGVGWLLGPVVGATLAPGALGNTFAAGFGTGVQQYVPLVGGVLLLITILTGPDGVAAAYWIALRRVRSILFKPPRPLSVAVDAVGDATADVPSRHSLQVVGVSVLFGPNRALDDVTLEVRSGEVVGLIGPNGAGKTVLAEVVTGFTSAAGGTVRFDGIDITRRSAAARSRLGIVRSFQSLELFDDMTVLDNIRVASDGHEAYRYVTDLVRPGRPEISERTMRIVEEFELAELLDKLPSELTYGRRRLLAIARAVAAQPSILILDEPAAGLDDIETAELTDVIRGLASRRGMGVILIEHHVEMVLGVSDRIYALQFGRLLASGSAEEVSSDQRVIESYLGKSLAVDDYPHGSAGS
jgi:ABC-type branched-subunit amino acid transport system ATPase component/branched-subunit amino acid ABC-type transport system permease component